MLVVAECAKCSDSFEYEKAGRGRPRRYCDECRRVDARRRHESRPMRQVGCEACGKVVLTHAPNRRFCSPKCKSDHCDRSRSCTECGAAMWKGGGGAEAPVCRRCRVPSCGTVASYRRGCRCGDCRAAKAANIAAYKRQRRRERVAALRACRHCGSEFQPRSNQVLCSPECRKATLNRLGDHASRAAYWGVEYEAIDRLAIFERDGWLCGVCELPVERDLTFPDPGYPTLDHIVPLSLGGGHVPMNVQLAHFYCNTVKGAREEVASPC